MRENKFLVLVAVAFFLFFAGCGSQEKAEEPSSTEEATGNIEDMSHSVKKPVSETVEAVKAEAVDSVQHVVDTSKDAEMDAAEAVNDKADVTSTAVDTATDAMGSLEEKADSSQDMVDQKVSDAQKTVDHTAEDTMKNLP